MGPGVPTSVPSWRVATTWPSRGQHPSWCKHVRVRSIPMVYGQKTNHRRFPVDPTIPHAPTRESVPSDHRTKRCRRGSEPIVYGSRPCNFAAEGKVAESEESRSVRAQTLVRFSSKSFGIFFLFTLTPRKISQLKWHPSPHKNNIRNGLSTKPVSPVTAAYGA